jgi:hypothetical protein
LTWKASAFASSAQAEDADGEEEGDGLADGLAVGDPVAVGLAVGLADGVGDADWLADALGLGEASVIVIVVTPPDADTLTRAPVAPSRNTPEIAPDFA